MSPKEANKFTGMWSFWYWTGVIIAIASMLYIVLIVSAMITFNIGGALTTPEAIAKLIIAIILFILSIILIRLSLRHTVISPHGEEYQAEARVNNLGVLYVIFTFLIVDPFLGALLWDKNYPLSWTLLAFDAVMYIGIVLKSPKITAANTTRRDYHTTALVIAVISIYLSIWLKL